MIFETARFRDQFKKDDETSKRKLVLHVLDISNSQISDKNRNYLTEGKIGEVSRQLGVSIRKERLTGKGRILFYHNDDDIHLVDYDWDHSSVDSLESQSQSSLKKILRNENPSPNLSEWVQAAAGGDLISLNMSSGSNRDTYAEELSDEWIRFLDLEQSALRDELFKQLQAPEANGVYLILGGAGTGKTMVLLDLAWKLTREADIPVRLDMPEGVREYLAKSEQDYWFQKAKSGRIVLLDDPKDFDAMEAAINSASSHRQAIVIAIDPTQWTHKRTRDKFWRFLMTKNPRKYELTTAYRQGGAIGREVLKVLNSFYDSASMFAGEEKVLLDRGKAEYWETLCLKKLKHVDDLGFFAIHLVTDEDDFRSKVAIELEGVLAFDTYRRWPKLLIGLNLGDRVPRGLTEALSDAQMTVGRHCKFRSYYEVHKVRGVEFESVFVFLSVDQFRKLNKGPTGLSGPDYESITQPLTFLTRAENRLAIFVLPFAYPHDSISN
jgi:hypothetical protein